MKKILLYISICFYSLSYGDIQETLQQQLLQDSQRWKKTKEEASYQEFTGSKTAKETITLSLKPLKPAPYHANILDLRNDLFSLFEKEPPSALKEMKRLRIESKKKSSPYSLWRLLYVFDQDDIIYECRVPDAGPYPPSYEITRLIKQHQGYLKITYRAESEVDKQAAAYWLQRFQELS